MTQSLDDGFFWETCPVCRKQYVTDGGDPTCGDVVCDGMYERSVERTDALQEVEALLDEEYWGNHPVIDGLEF